ncbi:MAG: TetR/AcrR family transcriptional regulator [Magnetovibrio sp.]|nr:TetR/AcrR family transcriptional regulator [Magnetovibrio sp.]
MARPQLFDRSTVLTQALNVFWRKGYDGASIQDLVDATGLNRGSLYNSFGDKDELFAEVMLVYRSLSPTKILTNASATADVSQLFQDFFQILVDRAEQDPDHKGCLMTNTAAGFYGCSESMADWVCESLDGLESLFVRLIERGQEFDDISSTTDPIKLARFLVAAAQGMNVMARTGADVSVLQDIADQTLQALNP